MDAKTLQLAISEEIAKANWSFRGNIIFGLSVVIIVTALCWMTISRASMGPQSQVLDSVESILDESARANRRLIDALVSVRSGIVLSQQESAEFKALVHEETLAFDRQNLSAKRLLDELKISSSKAGETLVPYANFITGGLILGLLAFLGLNRLGQIDGELKNVRDNILKDVSERVRLSEEATAAKLSAEVRAQIDLAKEAVRATSDQATKEFDALRSASAQLIDQAKDAQSAVIKDYKSLTGELSQLSAKYPFLASSDTRDQISRIELVKSVQQAEALASEFGRKGEVEFAIKSLEQVVDRSLVGDADDLHNAHSEAMRLKDVSLGLRIAEYGHAAFPGNADLAADLVLALTNSCRPQAATDFGESWLARFTGIERSWRFGTFLAQAYRAQGIDAAKRAKVIDLLDGETKAYPSEAMLWFEFSRVLRTSDPQRSYDVLEEGLVHCPDNQHLRFEKAKYLLQAGRAKEAKGVLESAIAVDFQDQFQPSVNAAAVLMYYAQCLEAIDSRDEARRVYRAAELQLGASPGMKAFIRARTKMLDVLDGKEVEPEASAEDLIKFIQNGAAIMGRHEASGIADPSDN